MSPEESARAGMTVETSDISPRQLALKAGPPDEPLLPGTILQQSVQRDNGTLEPFAFRQGNDRARGLEDGDVRESIFLGQLLADPAALGQVVFVEDCLTCG